MREDKWLDTKAMIKSKFTVLAEGREDIADIPGGFEEHIEFSAPGGSAPGGEISQGRMKLTRTTTPAVIDKRTTYSKLGGRASRVEYQYSPDEVVHRLRAYRFDEGLQDWEEVKAPVE